MSSAPDIIRDLPERFVAALDANAKRLGFARNDHRLPNGLPCIRVCPMAPREHASLRLASPISVLVSLRGLEKLGETADVRGLDLFAHVCRQLGPHATKGPELTRILSKVRSYA